MKYRLLLIGLCLAAGVSGCSRQAPDAEGGPPAPAPAAEARPNILFVVVDDLGYTDLGAFGSEIPTPNLDRLAFGGLRLTNLRSAANCQTTRIMLMASTSISAGEAELPEDAPRPDGVRSSYLSRDWATMAALLRDAGYSTYMAGKWDLGSVPGLFPPDRGFDRSFALVGASGSHFAAPFRGGPFVVDGELVAPEELPADFYSTEFFTDRILQYLSEHEGGRPWFAYLPFSAMHWPLHLPDDWLDRHAGRYDAGYDELREARVARARELGVLPDAATLDTYRPGAEPWAGLSAEEQRKYARAQEIYAGMLEYVDMSVGRLVDYLVETDQLANTVIMVSSDNGSSSSEAAVYPGRLPAVPDNRADERFDNRFENFGRMGSFIDHGRGFAEAATAPFREFKASLFDGGLRAAALIYYPAAVPAGGLSGEFLTVMDILPTFLEIAGTEHPGAGEFHGRHINGILGRSFWPYVTGQASSVHPPEHPVGWIRQDAGALIRGDYKIVNDVPFGEQRLGGGMGMGPPPTAWRLYDIANDPGETTDLAAELPELTAELVAEWEANWQ